MTNKENASAQKPKITDYKKFSNMEGALNIMTLFQLHIYIYIYIS